MQINLKLSDKMFKSAKKQAEKQGFDTVQDFIRETMRQRLFEEPIGGIYTAKASEESLARHWLSKEEDAAWAHLQKVK